MANIEKYTDNQLQQSLREHGMNVPVTPTTRKVCESKLKKLMAQANGTFYQTNVFSAPDDLDSSSDSSHFGKRYGHDDVDREITPQLPEDSVIHRRNLPSAQRQKELNRQNYSEPDQSDEDPGETSVRELSPQEQRRFQPKAQDPSRGRSWNYIGLTLLLLTFLAFVFFLNRNARKLNDEI